MFVMFFKIITFEKKLDNSQRCDSISHSLKKNPFNSFRYFTVEIFQLYIFIKVIDTFFK